MKKLLRSSMATMVAVAGLLTIASLPANASAKKTTITCYQVKAGKVISKKVKAVKPACPKGFSKHKPTIKPAVSLQGTNKPGDIDLSVSGSAQLNINGSSFDAPMVAATTTGSTGYTAGGKVSFSQYPAAGSGSGRAGITSNPPSLNIGFSDQPMSAAAGTLPTGAVAANYAQVPYILGGAVVGYNLGAGFDHLKLTAAEIGKIYNGGITMWSDPAIVATNGGSNSTLGKALAGLATSNGGKPEAKDTIKVLYRSGASGTTFAFTDYMYRADGGTTPAASGNPMEGSGNLWKATNILGAANNSAMAQELVGNVGSIGYVEYSYLLVPGNAPIQTAQLQDKNGQWLVASLTNIAASAAAAGKSITPDNFSIVYEPGNNVWPFSTYSWAIVAKSQSNQATGEAIVKYLDWETHYAQGAYALASGYIPLPSSVAAYSRQQLLSVTYNGQVLLNMKN